MLFDPGVPQPLRRELAGHVVDTVYERGWSTLSNGVLLATAEQAEYDVFITTDQNLRYQQNLTGRRLAILVLRTTSWPKIRNHRALNTSAVDAMSAGSYLEVSFEGSP